VARGGYAWWYVDALSDDGRHGLSIIGFVGSVFSPYYAGARRRSPRGVADPLSHCAMNVALYGPGRNRWAMTERGRGRLQRSATSIGIGPSSMRWERDALVIEIDEVTAPIPSRLRGVVRVHPHALVDHSFALDDAGRHRWHPIAPCARVEVALTHPACTWRGGGYLDSNAGDRPLENDFARWDWSRAALARGRTAVLYDVARRGAAPLELTLCFDPAGGMSTFEAPQRVALATTGWRLPRGTRSDAQRPASVATTLESAPFYARSVVDTSLLGEPGRAMHESLSLDRFDTRWCQWMLPFRMPRTGG